MSAIAVDLQIADAPPMAAPRRGRRVRRALGRSLGVVAVGFVLGLVGLAVVSRVSSPGGTVLGHPVMTMLSGSMSPEIRTGDLVVDRPVSPQQTRQLQAGQIITFRTPSGKVFTHRIAAVEHGPGGSVAYQTKGDANNAPDAGTVSPGDVEGLYSWSLPFGGYVVAALHQPLVIGLLLLSVLLALASAALRRQAGSASAQQ